MFVITTDNASNNKTMVASLEKIMNENGSKFTKQHNVSCMAHVLNLVVQGGLKELGNPSLTSKYSDGEDDEGCDKDVLEVSSKKVFGKILRRLRKLVLMANSAPQRILQYKEMCEKHKMPNKNLLITDVRTRWNSTYDMIIEAWEKRKVLNAMATTCQKDGKDLFFYISRVGAF